MTNGMSFCTCALIPSSMSCAPFAFYGQFRNGSPVGSKPSPDNDAAATAVKPAA